MASRSGVLLISVMALAAAGCGSDSDASPSASPTTDAVTTADQTTTSSTSPPETSAAESAPETTPEDISTLPEGAEDLVGRFAHFDVVAYEDDVMQTLIISTGFADLEMRDGVLWNSQEFCHADMGSNQDIETTMSDAATTAIIPVDTPVEVTLEDGRLRVVRPPTPTGIGIDFADPANDVLPTDPNDPRITDADGDGNPGVTAHIRLNDAIEGDLYLARREIFSYDVTQESPDRLVGTITDESEQLILGASNDIFLTPAQWEQVPDPARNPVIWQRVEADWDCARLAAERDEIFPPNPLADW